MSNLGRVKRLKIGKHASINDFTADAVSSKFVEVMGEVDYNFDYNYLTRDLEGPGDNENDADLQGKKTAALTLPIRVRGLGTTGGDGVTVSANNMDAIAEIFDSLLGAAGSMGTGDTTDAVDAGTGAQVIVDAAPATANPNGNAFLIKGTTSGKYVAREVVSLSVDTYTLDRPLTDDDGNADTPNEGQVAFASASWYFDADAVDHTHLWADIEGKDWRRKVFGMLGSFSLQFPSAGIVTANVSLQGSNWSSPATGLAAYSAPTSGSEIVVVDSPLWIGNTQYMAYDFTIESGIAVVPRKADESITGNNGFVVKRMKPTMKCKIRRGALTREATDALVDTWRGDTLQDVAFQSGRSAGSAIYVRMPNAKLKVKEARDDGLEVLEVTFEANRSSNHANVPGACRIHLF